MSYRRVEFDFFMEVLSAFCTVEKSLLGVGRLDMLEAFCVHLRTLELLFGYLDRFSSIQNHYSFQSMHDERLHC